MRRKQSSLALPGDWKPVAEEVDRFGHAPALRLGMVFCLFFAPFLAVLARLGYLQFHLAHNYVAHLNRPHFQTEFVAPPRGRILAVDGTVLAEDKTLLSLAVHYRWLEQPPNDAWVTREARRRLSRNERRDKHRLNQEKRYVLADRQRLWKNLADETGEDLSVLRDKARAIQDRVETIAEQVNARYRRAHESAEPEEVTIPAEAPWWRRATLALIDALQAAPEPEETPLLTISEQEAYHPVVAGVSPAVVAEVEGKPHQFPGVKVVVETERRYPLGRLACHLLGYVSPVTQEDLRLQARGDGVRHEDPYQPTDRIGRQGLERYYERWLRGRRGEAREMVGAGGTITPLSKREPEPGVDLVLSLDPALQRHAEQQLEDVVSGSNGSAAAVLDVNTGEVLTAASAPGFDLNLIRSDDPEDWATLSSHPGRPLFNRATGANLPPGSIFKALSALAFVESGLVNPHDSYYCQGYLRSPNRLRCLIYTRYGANHADTSLVGALKESCNVYFFHHAERIGPTRLCHWAEVLGFGRPTGIDLPGESGGYLPTPENVRARLGHAWRGGDTPRLAIGQAALTVTPLQIARLMAAIANGGNLVTPHLVRAATPSPLSDRTRIQGVPETAPATKIEGLTASKLKPIRDGLKAVVEERRGTGYRWVRLEGVEVAGKTGTAETGAGRKPHAWFAGYAPADHPRVAFAVVLEHAGAGGAKAGPVAKSLLEKMIELGYFPESAQEDIALRDTD